MLFDVVTEILLANERAHTQTFYAILRPLKAFNDEPKLPGVVNPNYCQKFVGRWDAS